jgi:hypothetical protein
MARSQPYPLELIDETLDINATDNYDLTLELSEDGVSLAVLDLLRGKYVMLRHYPREEESGTAVRSFDETVGADDFLKRRYRKVFIVAPSLNATMIPAAVYENGLREDYFRFNFGSADSGVIISNTITFADAIVLFSPAKEVTESISSRWRDISPWHHTKPLLSHVSAVCRTNDGCYVHLHFEKDFVTVVTAEKRNLTFCNSFATSSPQDGAYYLFSVLERNGIRHDETIHVSGSVEPYGEAHIALLSFAQNVRFASPAIRHGFSYVMNEVQLHRWLNLFTAASCE